MTSATGHDVRLIYLWEDNGFLGSPNDTTYKTFGSDATLDTFEISNNVLRLFDPGSREAAKLIAQQFEGAFSVSFVVTNPWWLRAVISAVTNTSGTSAPFTHTFGGDIPTTMQLYVYDENNDYDRTLQGAVVNSMTLSAAINGNATVTLDGVYADESLTEAPSSPQSQVAATKDPMTFAQATIERPSGTTLSLTQDASLTIQNNVDLIRELGSRFAVDYSPKIRAASIDYTDIVHQTDEVKRAYGDSAASSPQSKVDNTTTIDFVLDNGESGSSKNAMTVSLATTLADSYGVSGAGDPESNLEGSLSEMAATVEATAENSSSSPV